MLKLVRLLFLALLATALVWAIVVWQWQTSRRAIDTQDILLYLVLLPLLVVGGALALRWAWRRAALAQAARASAAASAAAPAAAAPVAERQLTMQVLAQGIAMPGAGDTDSALELINEPPPVQLDPLFRDGDGLGVFSRRCTGIEGEAPARAVQLAEQAIAPVLQWLHQAAPPVEPPAPEEAEAQHPTLVTRRRAAPVAKPSLHLLWGVDERHDAQARAAIAQQAGTLLGQWAAQLPAFDWQLEVSAVRSGVALLLQAERRLVMSHRDGRDDRLLVLAAESLVDEALVDRLDAAGQLFTAQRPSGVMPGEAAAALLLAPPARDTSTPAADGGAPAVQLHRLSAQRRDKSADAPGHLAATELTEAVRQAIEVSQVPVEQLSRAVSDTDLQRSRTSEFFDALQQVAPRLGQMELCRCAGAATGSVGIAAAPLALALAAAQVQRGQAPTLMLSHADPFDRLAVVLSAPANPTA
ncbi:hypothetical protein [Ideonella sp. BN130291]|uniref:hypothetical protein n=1 Tax=Ideonella sp. BN130291 TaxID=3112940 RepID=UPI002E25EF89|nr:hypothetical protein [Ideonella sp. BN130291]